MSNRYDEIKEVENYGMTPKQWAQLADSDANPLD